MKRYIAISAIATMLMACSAGQDAQDVQTSDTSPTQTVPESVHATKEEKGIDVLARLGVLPDFKYAVGYDFIDKNREGKRRHRVLLEVLDADIGAATTKMETTLKGLGYVKAKESTTDGKVEQVFRKKGSPTLVLLSQSATSGLKLKHPDAFGSIHVMWNIP